MSGDLLAPVREPRVKSGSGLGLGAPVPSLRCPACRKPIQGAHKLECQHSICHTCYIKVEKVLLFLETRRNVRHVASIPNNIGWFMCPLCNRTHIIQSPPPLPSTISRLLQDIETKVHTISRKQARRSRSVSNTKEENGGYISKDGSLWDELKLEQQKQDLEKMLASLQETLNIKEKCQLNLLNPESSPSFHQTKSNNIDQLNRILSHLENITTLLQTSPMKTPPNSEIPKASLSYLMTDFRPLYESVLCTLPISLSSRHYSPIPFSNISHPLYIEGHASYEHSSVTVKVSVHWDDLRGCCLQLKPPKAGILMIVVSLNGESLRGSPYRVKINALSLKELESQTGPETKNISVMV